MVAYDREMHLASLRPLQILGHLADVHLGHASLFVPPTMSFAAETSFRLSALVLVLDLVVLTLAYPPACNLYYGRPTYNHCLALISGSTLGIGISRLGRTHNFYGVSGIERPPEISALQVRVCF